VISSLKEVFIRPLALLLIWYPVFALTLIIVVILEMFIGTDKELGHLIYNAHMTYRIPEMYATIVITGLIGYGMNKGFIKLLSIGKGDRIKR
jgi:hypothetical protein